MAPDLPPCPVPGCTEPCTHLELRRLVYVVPDRLRTPPSPFPAAKRLPVTPKR